MDTINFKCGREFHLKSDISCDVKNVICSGCNEEFIGDTGDLGKRVSIHNQQIRDVTKRMLLVSMYIDEFSATVSPK